MDEGRDRRRARHGVRQPDVERDLRALAHGADEEAEGHEAGERQAHHDVTGGEPRLCRDAGEQIVIVERAEIREQGEHAHEEGEIADAVDDERLLAGVGRERLIVIETDEQVRAEAHPFPAHEHHQVVVAQDQQQHRRHEQVQVGEVAAVPLLVGHVAGGVDVDQETHEGDDEQHHRRQPVEQEGRGDQQVARRPGVEHLLVGVVRKLAVGVLPEAAEGDEERQQRRAHAHGGDQGLGEPPAEQAVDGGAGERQDGDQPEKCEHGAFSQVTSASGSGG